MKLLRDLLICALALAIAPNAWSQTEQEPNNSLGQANDLAYDTPITGSIGSCTPADNSSDYFKAEPTTQGVIHIEVAMSNAGGTNLPITVRLTNSSGTTLATWTATSGANGTAVTNNFSVPCSGIGTYYIVISGPGAGCTSYSLKYHTTSPLYAADSEPNNSLGQAADTLLAGEVFEGRIGFYYGDNNDYVRILPMSDGVLAISLSAEKSTGGSGDSTSLSLRNANGTTLATWRSGVGQSGVANTQTFHYQCMGSGQVYFLEVHSPSACGISYSMQYSIAPPLFGSDTEPNQSTGQAWPVAANTIQDGHLSFYYGDNSDYFKLQAPNDGQLVITLQAEHAGAVAGTMPVYLRNNSGTTLATWSAGIGPNGVTSDNTFSWTCTGTEQVYYLELYSPSLCGVSYQFNYNVQAPVFADDQEPNQSTATALPTAAGADHEGRINFDYDNNSDMYKLQAPDDGVLTVNVSAEHAGATAGTMTVYLRNNSGTTLATWSAGIGPNGVPSDNTFTWTCTGTEQMYYLELYSPSLCGVSYQFNYNVQAPVFADDQEPNQSTGTAVAAAAGADHEGRINFNYDNNSDMYKLQAPDDGVLTVNVSAEHAGATVGTMTVYLRNNSGTTLATWSAGIGAEHAPASNTFTHSCTGTEAVYYLELYSPTSCGVSYLFNYSVASPLFADDVEPNQSTGNAIPVDLQAAPAFGRLAFEYDNNNDYFRINHTGGVIEVMTQAENAGPADVFTVYIRNASGSTIVLRNDVAVGGNGVPVADTTRTTASMPAGTYYVELYSPSVCGVSYKLDCFDDDGDGICNGTDLCPNTPANETANADGCSCSQLVIDDGDACTLDECTSGIVTHTFQDADGDGTCDALDGCPNDPDKTSPGACGCGVPDVPATYYADADGDGFGDPGDSITGYTCVVPPGYVPDNTDLCPNDPHKQSPGACGCGVPDTDTDGEGLPDCLDNCPTLAGEQGDACDDGDPTTGNDVITTDCECVGQPLDCLGVPGGTAVAGTPCDDGNPATSNDTWNSNCQCVGTLPNDCLGVPGGSAQPGTPCDDGNAATVNDTWDSNCNCLGQTLDCLGVPGGTATAGTPCDDGNAATVNDTWDNNCNCVGQTLDCLGAPGGTATAGTPCDDGNAATVNDTWDSNCNCVGQTLDCLGVPGGIATAGTPCDDGDPNTVNDMFDVNCNCTGTPTGTCTGDQVMVSLATDANAGQLSWVITDGAANVVASGGPFAGQNNTTVNTTACLGSAPGNACYGFRLYDSFGDGIANGGWELRTTDGKLILRDDFASGSQSPAAATASPAYGDAHSFCLPLGPVNIAPTECGIFNNLMGNKVYAVKQAGKNYLNQTLNYQFEFSDPDAGFIRRIARPQNYVIFWDMVTNPLTPGVKYFARVRTDKSGPMTEAHWGTGCEMGIGLDVLGCTGLIPAPAYGHSCNETRSFGNSSFIYATPVQAATEYEFRIFNTGEGYDQTFVRSTYILQLKWNASVAPPLVNGYTYQVQARAKVGGVWGAYCGSTCPITINNVGSAANHMTMASSNAILWPNPVRDGQVNLNIDGLLGNDQRISVDVKDIFGKQVFAREYGNSSDRFNTILNLPGDLASGVYMVQITINGQSTVQRLSIVR